MRRVGFMDGSGGIRVLGTGAHVESKTGAA